jgi:hypothetical protein
MDVLYNLLKFFHIFFAIAAVGSNLTYGVWAARAGSDEQRASFTFRGIKFLDDRVANPAYGLLLLTGLIMAGWHWSYTTQWIAAAIGLYLIAIVIALAAYSPALTRQIKVLESEGISSSAYRRASGRATALGIAVSVPVVLILILMVFKPNIG